MFLLSIQINTLSRRIVQKGSWNSKHTILLQPLLRLSAASTVTMTWTTFWFLKNLAFASFFPRFVYLLFIQFPTGMCSQYLILSRFIESDHSSSQCWFGVKIAQWIIAHHFISRAMCRQFVARSTWSCGSGAAVGSVVVAYDGGGILIRCKKRKIK